jgi:anti-anti-sigma factor
MNASGADMDELFTLRRSGSHALVVFRTPSLMNAAEMERITADLARLVRQDAPTHLVLDFRHVHYASSQALSLVLLLKQMLNQGQPGGGRLVLCRLGSQLIRLLNITRLDRILTIKATRTEAISAMSA